jgi:hypothetical protein
VVRSIPGASVSHVAACDGATALASASKAAVIAIMVREVEGNAARLL